MANEGYTSIATMPRLRDIAERSGVSIRTVGRVLAGRGYVRESVRDRVLQPARAMNYQPNRFAKSLSTQRSYEVTVLLLSSDELHMAQLAGFEHGLRGSDYHLNALCELNPPNVEPRYDQIIEELTKRDPDGVALIGAEHEASEKLPQQLVETGIPYILLDGHGTVSHLQRAPRDRTERRQQYQQVSSAAELGFLPRLLGKNLGSHHAADCDLGFCDLPISRNQGFDAGAVFRDAL
jgi:DNA-binding LacI/PurR family transcriptional regulator